MSKFKNLVVLYLVGLCLAFPASAKELAEGTVIEAANLESISGDTFEGHVIGEILTERQKWMIKNHNLKMKLGNVEPLKVDDRYWALSEKHAGEAKLNPDTRQLENWTAGMPFPMSDIEVGDPSAGDKLIWNFFVYQTEGDSSYFPFTYLLVDGTEGVERTQDWLFIRVKMRGRASKNNEPVLGDGDEGLLNQTLITARYPRDIRGLGTLAKTYYIDKKDDSFAYLPAVRRIRRLSGGAWTDPIGGSDQLQDDINIWNTHPNWYDSIKLIEKRWILTIPKIGWSKYPDKENQAERYPHVDLQNPPYWNPVGVWDAREVYVIEADAPDIHPYSKKIMYMSTDFPFIYQGETYDKKGDFWKYIWWLPKNTKAEDGYLALNVSSGFILDYQRMHGTILQSTPDWKINVPGIGPEDASLPALQSQGR